MKEKIRIILADDHIYIRQGIRALIEAEPHIDIVGEADNGSHALYLSQALAPDVVIMDVSMPELNGMDATREILKINPKIKIIAFSIHTERWYVKGMLEAGASAYLLKECLPQELLEAIHAVVNDEYYLSAKIEGVVVREFLDQLKSHQISKLDSLTAREKEVLKLIVEGRNTKQIAGDLNISIKTVNVHSRNLMDKVGIDLSLIHI